MCVNNGNWQFTKPLCSGIKRKLSGEPWPQGSNEVERDGRGCNFPRGIYHDKYFCS